MDIISLTGFMGSGKTSVGKELAILLDRDFFDLDELIAEREGRTVSRIFAEDGEQGFRDAELAALKHFLKPRRGTSGHSAKGRVLALGGGTILRPEALELIRKYSTCIYLQASPDTLFGNLSGDCGSRPLLGGAKDLRKRIEELLSAREEAYLAAADACVITDGLSPAQVAGKIKALLQEKNLQVT